ncbi:MAG TPA: lipid II flippase MurJ, partial [Thermomicrobiaceae bacterium]|nr:lipid II flippase MurJ [Thermomicrobiaceae bacterium]
VLTLGRTSFGIRSLAIGTVIGTLGMIVIQFPGLRDVHLRLNFHFRHPAIKQILALYLPIFVGLISNMVALIIDRNLAWGIGEYALAAMRYGTTLNQLILGLVATATSLAALPTLSRHFANRDEQAFQRVLSNGIKMVTILVVPATFGLAAIAWPTVDLLFFHGATTQGGAHATLIALLAYLPGTFFAAFDQVLIFTYYARHNTRTPVIVGVLAVGVYLVFALTLIHPFGMAGLVLANSAQFIFHGLVMWWLVRRLLGPTHAFDHTVARTLRVSLLVGLAMAGIVFVLAKGLEMASLGPLTSINLLHRLIVVALPIVVGAVIYLGGLHLFGVDEVGMLTRGVKQKLGLRPGVSS